MCHIGMPSDVSVEATRLSARYHGTLIRFSDLLFKRIQIHPDAYNKRDSGPAQEEEEEEEGRVDDSGQSDREDEEGANLQEIRSITIKRRQLAEVRRVDIPRKHRQPIRGDWWLRLPVSR